MTKLRLNNKRLIYRYKICKRSELDIWGIFFRKQRIRSFGLRFKPFLLYTFLNDKNNSKLFKKFILHFFKADIKYVLSNFHLNRFKNNKYLPEYKRNKLDKKLKKYLKWQFRKIKYQILYKYQQKQVEEYDGFKFLSPAYRKWKSENWNNMKIPSNRAYFKKYGKFKKPKRSLKYSTPLKDVAFEKSKGTDSYIFSYSKTEYYLAYFASLFLRKKMRWYKPENNLLKSTKKKNQLKYYYNTIKIEKEVNVNKFLDNILFNFNRSLNTFHSNSDISNINDILCKYTLYVENKNKDIQLDLNKRLNFSHIKYLHKNPLSKNFITKIVLRAKNFNTISNKNSLSRSNVLLYDLLNNNFSKLILNTDENESCLTYFKTQEFLKPSIIGLEDKNFQERIQQNQIILKKNDNKLENLLKLKYSKILLANLNIKYRWNLFLNSNRSFLNKVSGDLVYLNSISNISKVFRTSPIFSIKRKKKLKKFWITKTRSRKSLIKKKLGISALSLGKKIDLITKKSLINESVFDSLDFYKEIHTHNLWERKQAEGQAKTWEQIQEESRQRNLEYERKRKVRQRKPIIPTFEEWEANMVQESQEQKIKFEFSKFRKNKIKNSKFRKNKIKNLKFHKNKIKNSKFRLDKNFEFFIKQPKNSQKKETQLKFRFFKFYSNHKKNKNFKNLITLKYKKNLLNNQLFYYNNNSYNNNKLLRLKKKIQTLKTKILTNSTFSITNKLNPLKTNFNFDLKKYTIATIWKAQFMKATQLQKLNMIRNLRLLIKKLRQDDIEKFLNDKLKFTEFLKKAPLDLSLVNSVDAFNIKNLNLCKDKNYFDQWLYSSFVNDFNINSGLKLYNYIFGMKQYEFIKKLSTLSTLKPSKLKNLNMIKGKKEEKFKKLNFFHNEHLYLNFKNLLNSNLKINTNSSKKNKIKIAWKRKLVNKQLKNYIFKPNKLFLKSQYSKNTNKVQNKVYFLKKFRPRVFLYKNPYFQKRKRYFSLDVIKKRPQTLQRKRKKQGITMFAYYRNIRWTFRRFYGCLTEYELKNICKRAYRIRGATLINFMLMLETRLDTVLYRSGFAISIFEARQLISHKKILVNGEVINRRSYLLKPNDILSVKKDFQKKLHKLFLFRINTRTLIFKSIPYLEINYNTLKVMFLYDLFDLKSIKYNFQMSTSDLNSILYYYY